MARPATAIPWLGICGGAAGDGLELSQQRLTRVAKLYDRLGKLAGEPRYSRFFAEAESEFGELDRKTVDFLRRAATSLTLAERLRTAEKEASLRRTGAGAARGFRQ